LGRFVGVGAAGIERRGVGGGWAPTRVRRIDSLPVENARDFANHRVSLGDPHVGCQIRDDKTEHRILPDRLLIAARIWVLG